MTFPNIGSLDPLPCLQETLRDSILCFLENWTEEASEDLGVAFFYIIVNKDFFIFAEGWIQFLRQPNIFLNKKRLNSFKRGWISSYSSLLFVWKVRKSWGEAALADHTEISSRYLCRGNTLARNQVCVFCRFFNSPPLKASDFRVM